MTRGEHAAGLSADERLVSHLRHCAGFLRHHTEERGSQRRVLFLLRRHGPMGQHELLERLGVRPSSLSELLGKLEARGCINRKKNENDRRGRSIAITADGLALLEELQGQYETAMADLFSGLTEEDKTQLTALLEKLSGLWRERVVPPAHHHGHDRERR